MQIEPAANSGHHQTSKMDTAVNWNGSDSDTEWTRHAAAGERGIFVH